ncbi:glycosyltransferase BC10-like [Diospyros lotus]|uniref:glycosyltransferase BC10-like n=1 Tax=Diospyros lotus TaxID=55363 RepID=UPI002257CA40|nr:glycosyltransferase BC10-like [Diospyros lotus]
MGNEPHQSPVLAKLFNGRIHLGHALQFLLFLIGFTLGFIASLHLQSFPINLEAFSSSPSPPPPPPPPAPVENSRLSMEDAELFEKASQVPTIPESPHKPIPKVAFLFLTKGPLPLAPLWEKFFRGHEELYSIYVHPDPLYNRSVPETSVFHGKTVPSERVEWGKPSMIDAERRLLANALLDISNERFILLSDTCIPLFNFTTVYSYLINSSQAFVASYDDPRKIGRGRYNTRMGPTISISQWRKGSQWFELNRRIAFELVSDQKYYPIFRDFCHPPCYTDEHYIPTVVNILCPEQNSNRSVTWVDWSHNGPHPGRFGKEAVSGEFLDHIRFASECSYNGGNSSICFLFARKFLPNTLHALMQLPAF